MKNHASAAGRGDIGTGRKSVLLVAFHFPPIRGSSGWQRTLRFAQHLPKFGWNPVVLTVDSRAYEARYSESALGASDVFAVYRSFGLDTARHLSIFGRYPGALASPDRWATWKYHAVWLAKRIIRQHGVKALWSTFPIATAHRIGLEVAAQTQLPWIAEFRDPMWQGDYPPDRRMNAAWRSLEQDVFAHARAVVVTAPGAAATYRARFPAFDPEMLHLIENGFDEEAFRRAEGQLGMAAVGTARSDRPLTILHSGIVYRSERDPTCLFQAVAGLKEQQLISAAGLQIVFRASGDESVYQRDLESMKIADIVRLEPGVSYVEALLEMMMVDGLLVLQASNCNAQIPAKVYEYMRAGRPILALTDPSGDTANLIRSANAGVIGRLDSTDDIKRVLLEFMQGVRSGATPVVPREAVQHFSRTQRAQELARLLDDVTS